MLFSKKWLLPIHKILFRLSIRGMGIMNYYDWKISGERYFIQKFLKNYQIKTVFDVGANEGKYAELLLDLYDCEVYCFEPNPKPYEILKKKFMDHQKVKIFNAGLSEQEGESILFDYQDSPITSHGSLYPETITRIHKKDSKAYKISLTTLDKIVEDQKIQKIDLLKIDTEGHEFSVLKGAENSLKKGMIDVIQFEFNEFNVYSRVFFNDYVDYLKDYSLFRLLPNGLLPMQGMKPVECEIFGFQNIIAIRRIINK